MALYEANGLDQPGFVADQPDITLPKGAWTDSRNVRYRDGAVEKCRGYEQALGDLSATAIWSAPISDGTNYFWVYGSNTVMYATDGSTHADITGAVSLSAGDDLNFTGGAFHGYMLVNDGVNIPQSWTPSLGNDLISLTAWPAITCRVLRPFKDFLFAFRISDGSDYNPRLMRWSDRAAQGSLPVDWDFNDPNNQAGINELGQTHDTIVDATPLRDSLIIHKDQHTWAAEYIGGGDIFGFRQVFSQVGMIAEGCALTFGAQQLVVTDQDVIVHDGNSAQSILDRRARRWLFNRISTTRFRRSFVVGDFRNREAYICFPEAGYDWPNMALVWNWADNTLHPFDLGGPKTFATPGIIPGAAISFDADLGTFNEAIGTFDEETFNPFQSRILFTDAALMRAYQNDTGESYDGTPMTCYAERTAFPFVKDLMFIRRIKRIFPLVMGTPGDTLEFYIGSRATQDSDTSWQGPFTFTIGVDYKIDLRVSARLLDLRVQYAGENTFRLSGFKVEFENEGYR
jgi:hypothetical protein